MPFRFFTSRWSALSKSLGVNGSSSKTVAKLRVKIVAGSRYELPIKLMISGPSLDSAGALVAFVFYDSRGKRLTEKAAGLSQSRIYSAYKYLGAPRFEGELDTNIGFVSPAGAVRVDVVLQRWRAAAVKLLAPMKLASLDFGGRAHSGAGDTADEIVTNLRMEIEPERRYDLSASLIINHASAEKPAALAAFTFYDDQGRLLSEGPAGFAESRRYGYYKYFGNPGFEGELDTRITFTSPRAASRVDVVLYRWRAGIVTALKPLELHAPKTPEEIAREQSAQKVLGTVTADVIPGESYDVIARFAANGALSGRFALASIVFEAVDGKPIEPLAGTPKSTVVGDYRYFSLVDESAASGEGEHDASAAFVAPAGAARLTARILWWNAQEPISLLRSSIELISSSEKAFASGEAVLDSEGWFALGGRVSTAGLSEPFAGAMAFSFFDARGNLIFDPIEGLHRSDRFLNEGHVPAQNDMSADKDVEIEVFIPFRSPANARRVTWRLYPSKVLPQDFVIPSFGLERLKVEAGNLLSDPKVLKRQNGAISPEIADLLRRGIPTEPLMLSAALRRVWVLGEALTPTVAGEWIAVEGTIQDAAASALRDGFSVCPLYFDEHGVFIEATAVLGCRPSKTLGMFRSIAIQQDKSAQDGWFRESFLSPAGACFAVFHLVASARTMETPVIAFDCGKIAPEGIFTNIDFRKFGRARLKDALAVAEFVWDLKAQREIRIALSWAESDNKMHAKRAATLSDRLGELDRHWLPALPPRKPYNSDPASIMHLFKVIYPDESSGGAVRSTSIAEAQAARGLRPVVCMPFNARPVSTENLTAGISEVTRNGVSVNYLNFPEFASPYMPPRDVLTFESLMYEQVARTKACSLIHAASGFRGYEMALKGLAVAKANDLPMVYEVRSFHEHTWRPISDTQKGDTLTELRIAQENRCMEEADAVVTISSAMIEKLAERGVPNEKLFLVPNSISDEFRTLAPADDVEEIRQKFGLTGRSVLGYISNLSAREGHEVLVRAFARLVARGHDVHLVMVGEGPQHQAITAEVRRLGIQDRVCMPGSVDHSQIKAWYRCIDFFVVPRVRDFASDYVTPLKPFEAMSQAVPVFMSDVPVTREIAGAKEERAHIFPPGDDAALAELVVKALADPDAMKRRAEASRDWVLKERIWASTVQRYDEAYASARATHARRRRLQEAN